MAKQFELNIDYLRSIKDSSRLLEEIDSIIKVIGVEQFAESVSRNNLEDMFNVIYGIYPSTSRYKRKIDIVIAFRDRISTLKRSHSFQNIKSTKSYNIKNIKSKRITNNIKSDLIENRDINGTKLRNTEERSKLNKYKKESPVCNFQYNFGKIVECKEIHLSIIAIALKVDIKVVVGWKHGKCEPTLTQLVKLSSLLGVSTDELLL